MRTSFFCISLFFSHGPVLAEKPNLGEKIESKLLHQIKHIIDKNASKILSIQGNLEIFHAEKTGENTHSENQHILSKTRTNCTPRDDAWSEEITTKESSAKEKRNDKTSKFSLVESTNAKHQLNVQMGASGSLFLVSLQSTLGYSYSLEISRQKSSDQTLSEMITTKQETELNTKISQSRKVSAYKTLSLRLDRKITIKIQRYRLFLRIKPDTQIAYLCQCKTDPNRQITQQDKRLLSLQIDIEKAQTNEEIVETLIETDAACPAKK